MESPRWTFISNHGLVLSYVFHNPSHTTREIVRHVGVTERTTHKIISDLEAAGYIERRKSGLRNIYSVDPALPLRHRTKQDILVSDLLANTLVESPRWDARIVGPCRRDSCSAMTSIGQLTSFVSDTTMALIEHGALPGSRQLDMGNPGQGD